VEPSRELAQIGAHVGAGGRHALEIPAETEVFAFPRQHNRSRGGGLHGECSRKELPSKIEVYGVAHFRS
jgi:hypothetical protein